MSFTILQNDYYFEISIAKYLLPSRSVPPIICIRRAQPDVRPSQRRMLYRRLPPIICIRRTQPDVCSTPLSVASTKTIKKLAFSRATAIMVTQLLEFLLRELERIVFQIPRRNYTKVPRRNYTKVSSHPFVIILLYNYVRGFHNIFSNTRQGI